MLWIITDKVRKLGNERGREERKTDEQKESERGI